MIRSRWLCAAMIFALYGTQHAALCAAARPERNQRESFTSAGRRIRVDTFLPATREPRPAVLVLHSAAGTLIGKSELESFSRSLVAQGNVAFLVHYFDGTGTRFADDAAIERFTPTWMATIRDAVDFAASHPRVRSDSVGLFGYSLGAYLAVTESSLDSRIDAVAEVSGGIFGRYKSRVRRLPPVLILHGSHDQRVAVSEAYEVQRTARRFRSRSTLKIYPGEGHRLSPAATVDASRRALAFLDLHLKRRSSRQ
jgi:dienelactone hydrolase